MGYRNPEREAAAARTASFVAERLGINPLERPIGIILGTGWGDALTFEDRRVLPLGAHDGLPAVPGFEGLRKLAGHAREFVTGYIAGRRVIAHRGRIHMNEGSGEEHEDMVRLQTEVLFHLGIRDLILTNAVGSLRPFWWQFWKRRINVGDIMVASDFVTLFAPRMPLKAGEFCSPAHALTPSLRPIAMDVATRVGFRAHEGSLAMVLGPWFEGPHDKNILRYHGATHVGMSELPETCIAALYAQEGVRTLALSFVTNDESEHSHEENVARGKASAAKMGALLEGVIARIP